MICAALLIEGPFHGRFLGDPDTRSEDGFANIDGAFKWMVMAECQKLWL